MAIVLAEGISERLEAVGIDLWQGAVTQVSYTAIHPRRLRLEVSDGLDDQWNPVLSWDGVELRPFGAHGADRCLWEFLELRGKPDEAYVAFIERWGIPYDDWTGVRISAGSIQNGLDNLHTDVESIRLALQLLIATEDKKELPLASLAPLSYDGSHVRAQDARELTEAASAKLPLIVAALPRIEAAFGTEESFHALQEMNRQVAELEHTLWMQWRVREGREGHGIEYQRRLVAEFVNQWCPESGWIVTWVGDKRTVSNTARGFYALIGEQLRELFGAPTPDFYECSICGRLYSFQSTERHPRRPKRNARRYCTDDCRRRGKLDSNRASSLRTQERRRAHPDS